MFSRFGLGLFVLQLLLELQFSLFLGEKLPDDNCTALSVTSMNFIKSNHRKERSKELQKVHILVDAPHTCGQAFCQEWYHQHTGMDYDGSMEHHAKRRPITTTEPAD